MGRLEGAGLYEVLEMREDQGGDPSDGTGEKSNKSSDQKNFLVQRQQEVDEILLRFDQLSVDNQDDFKRYVQELVAKFGQ